ncbi:peptidase S8 [Flavobacterium sp. 316]|uniref:S8 family peptidase n=1 Tax=Flavobacterium sediminilitoris TaxID=2024526 RepID=A0ABY4HQF3_9FLAO|nr:MULTISPECIES: S8 family peptidase [Flavobacterium]KIX20572.1 peptidase S8 [Flavobacterium sp. 316]UOX34866.1 S8 family peptidase [Flavobacterium sediminilitoris]
MRNLKPIYLSTALALVLASCGGAKQIISTPVENIDTLPLKVTPLAENDLKRWSHLDLVRDTVPGMSVDKAYSELLKNKKGSTVIVGIVDSGVDIRHEDLQGVIWVNPKEIAGNGIDDDKNGYIDDINGWNFLGDSNNEQLEMTRIVKKGPGTPEYDKAKAQLEEELAGIMQTKQQIDMIVAADKAIKEHLKKDNFNLDDVKAIETSDEKLSQYKAIFTQILSGTSKEDFDKRIKAGVDFVYGQLNYNLNVDFDGRSIVGDNPEDIKDTKYGNNNVIGPDPEDAKHGTHVSGIVAQVRNNNKGGDGVANNVKIMAVRAVPNGDEYDKDIALGIRYAVDNGAKVINGSFGKYYSPNKEWVQDALKYAAKKDVLVIFAAGNDSKDLDVENKYPSDSYDGSPEISNNVLIIGALAPSYGINEVAGFSNYGTKNVDIFAPGVQIYATTPNQTYEYLQGTSMASPNVAGVAALIRSYYPKLSASQVKQIIMESGTPLKNEVKVGEDQHKANFSTISKTGKIVNAYNALLMAEQMSK